MFTGIVQEVGKINSVLKQPSGVTLEVVCRFPHLTLGESISVDGVCLTVTQISPLGFICEVSPETMNLTQIPRYQKETLVNLERALALGERFGGHWVSGHVDGTVTLVAKEIFKDFWKLSFKFEEPSWTQYLFSKASIALNGVSLTVNSVGKDFFEVMLIPHTIEKTNFKTMKLGFVANFEIDWMSKLIVKTLTNYIEAKNDI